jgi:hypothetical protein
VCRLRPCPLQVASARTSTGFNRVGHVVSDRHATEDVSLRVQRHRLRAGLGVAKGVLLQLGHQFLHQIGVGSAPLPLLLEQRASRLRRYLLRWLFIVFAAVLDQTQQFVTPLVAFENDVQKARTNKRAATFSAAPGSPVVWCLDYALP